MALLVGCGSAAERNVGGASDQQSIAVDQPVSGKHSLFLDGRPHQVLGVRQPRSEAGEAAQLVLLLRDEISGQIRFSRPGLQFSLRPGVDAEAFIREHPEMRRLFVNPLVVQALVDAEHIASQFEVLRADPRVERLTLLPIDAPRVPRQ